MFALRTLIVRYRACVSLSGCGGVADAAWEGERGCGDCSQARRMKLVKAAKKSAYGHVRR